MSTRKKPKKRYQNPIKQFWRKLQKSINFLKNRLLGGLFPSSRRRNRTTTAGFVLPTVAMVIVVVVLLTTAIVLRSFDRAKNASNVRINQAVLSASAPAIDRAKAKIEALFQDPLLPRGTPSEISINNVLEDTKYNFGDETRLVVGNDIDGDGDIDRNTTETRSEINRNVWRFPVDTNNDGNFDSFTLYGIFFRDPGEDEERAPVEARSLPMDSQGEDACADAAGTSASLVGTTGWYAVEGQLKKAMFVYTATVPITDVDEISNTIDNQNAYEPYSGVRGFSALEYQQDIARIPLANNAVVYEDDVEIFAGTPFTLNGRIVTNSNLFVYEIKSSAPVTFRQVSSVNSCFYSADNSKIVVGGNVGYGNVARPTSEINSSRGKAPVHLFQGKGNNPTIGIGDDVTLGQASQSVTALPAAMGYNNNAFERRIEKLIELGIAKGGNQTVSGTEPNITVSSGDPTEVREEVESRLNLNPGLDPEKAREDAMDSYFRKRTRRVPYQEVAFEDPETNFNGIAVLGSGDSLRPPIQWMFPYDPSDGKSAPGSLAAAKILNLAGSDNNKLEPPATEFDEQEKLGLENLVGDRVLVGNNLPELWWDGNGFVSTEETQEISGSKWDAPANTDKERSRKTRVETLAEAGDTTRDGFWESKAAEQPAQVLDGVGGLRVITGAGLYLPGDSTSTNITSGFSKVVWPDSLPVINTFETTAPTWLPNSDWPQDAQGDQRPYLRMRASAVYHFRRDAEGTDQLIACVANYYDPTNATTAQNRNKDFGNKNISDIDPPTNDHLIPNIPSDANGGSLNGITYPPHGLSYSGNTKTTLENQAELRYPNGRLVNPMLAQAVAAGSDFSLAEQAALDSSMCALSIFEGNINPDDEPTSGYDLPHGTITEIAFLDGREVKVIDAGYNPGDGTTSYGDDSLTTNYDLDLEQRYPLEVRATVLDLERLRTSTADGSTAPQEYMIPNSGILYATREDALPDASDVAGGQVAADDGSSNSRLASTDFKLDPTRRPDGIMLINGRKLWRDFDNEDNGEYRGYIEKGLILASNLPVYIQGEFNPHEDSSGTAQEEFDTAVTDDNFYARLAEDLNTDFACRVNDPRLPSGSCQSGSADQWRPATVLSDATILLSDNWRAGFRNEGDYDLRNNDVDLIGNPDGAGADELAFTFDETVWGIDIDGDGLNDDEDTLKEATVGFDFNRDGDKTDTFTSDDDQAIFVRYKRLLNGFYNNDFAVNGLSSENDAAFEDDYTDADYSVSDDPDDVTYSTYFNNGVTPVQRRLEGNENSNKFPEYVMEICRKLPISACTPSDWKVRLNGTDTSVGQVLVGTTLADLDTGTTAKAPENAGDERFPRRVAFLRDSTTNKLVLSSNKAPIPLGIDSTGKVTYYPYYSNQSLPITDNHYDASGTNTTFNKGVPRLVNNALWFKTTESTASEGPTAKSTSKSNTKPLLLKASVSETTQQPLLIPVLNIHEATVQRINDVGKGGNLGVVNWLPRVEDDDDNVIYNLVMATGDTPSRPPTTNHEGDIGGALSVLPRFIENWDGSTVQISGSFIQTKRSAYGDAPFWQLPESAASADPSDLFKDTQIYASGNNGKASYYEPPARNWGFDVGLLSQIPDLFSQQFVVSSDDRPNEFYREVGRNDDWVETLLCGVLLDNNNEPTNQSAINSNQRPNNCVNY
ncbi:MAG: hormogonium polysaccharide biosynthesis protein HpsA [Oscillatoria sp. PMC 1068.18]|nr:hormogonium polysaccharide biosynthesis protein HpsA [Oscillatoria sp. PMC 1076.18]MEC4989542.1 hormogonium polysaccharide biosynthesis protein HpsA [Oscillatoria sp. PMC 1068.18]